MFNFQLDLICIIKQFHQKVRISHQSYTKPQKQFSQIFVKKYNPITMKNSQPIPSQLWMDKVLTEQNNQNLNHPQSLNDTLKIQQKIPMNKFVLQEMPFVQRFRDRFFAFSKIGQIYKLDESKPLSIKASLVFTRSKICKNPCLRTILSSKNHSYYKKPTKSSRISLESKQTERQTRSLDASKISSIQGKQNKYRYGSDCYQIKEQDIQETIAKKFERTRRILTPFQPKRKNVYRKKAVLFESEGDSETPKELQNQVIQGNMMGAKVNTQNLQDDANLTIQNSNRKTPTFQNHPSDKKALPLVRVRPIESNQSKVRSIDTRRSLKQRKTILPKLELNFAQKPTKTIKQKLVTIR